MHLDVKFISWNHWHCSSFKLKVKAGRTSSGSISLGSLTTTTSYCCFGALVDDAPANAQLRSWTFLNSTLHWLSCSRKLGRNEEEELQCGGAQASTTLLCTVYAWRQMPPSIPSVLCHQRGITLITFACAVRIESTGAQNDATIRVWNCDTKAFFFENRVCMMLA